MDRMKEHEFQEWSKKVEDLTERQANLLVDKLNEASMHNDWRLDYRIVLL